MTDFFKTFAESDCRYDALTSYNLHKRLTLFYTVKKATRISYFKISHKHVDGLFSKYGTLLF